MCDVLYVYSEVPGEGFCSLCVTCCVCLLRGTRRRVLLTVCDVLYVFAQRYQEKGFAHCVCVCSEVPGEGFCSLCVTCCMCLLRGTRRRVLLTVCVFAQRYQEKGSDSEIRILIHQSQAGCVIGRAGFKIKELREVSRAVLSAGLANHSVGRRSSNQSQHRSSLV